MHLKRGPRPAQVGRSAGQIARVVCGHTGLLWHSGFVLGTQSALAVDLTAVAGTSACWLPLHHYHGPYEERRYLASAQESSGICYCSGGSLSVPVKLV